MKRLKIAIAIAVGVVARPGATPLPAPFGRLAAAGHLREVPQPPFPTNRERKP